MEMTNTICGCSDACVHVIGEGAVHAATFEHREVSSSSDAAAYEPLVHPDEVESFVRSVLARAAGDPDRVEFAGTASASAYMSLAEHRGVSLERVARPAAQGRLTDIVRLPPVRPEKRTRRNN